MPSLETCTARIKAVIGWLTCTLAKGHAGKHEDAFGVRW